MIEILDIAHDLDKLHGKNLNWLFELRGIGDYGDTRHVP